MVHLISDHRFPAERHGMMAFVRSHPGSLWASHNSGYCSFHSPIAIGNRMGRWWYRSSCTCHVHFTPSLPLGAALRWWVAAALWVVPVVVLMQRRLAGIFDSTLLPLDGTAQERFLARGCPRALATSERREERGEEEEEENYPVPPSRHVRSRSRVSVLHDPAK